MLNYRISLINITSGYATGREELQKDHCGAFCIRLR